MTQRPTRRGFTLIEVLVVVLIIGILAAIAVPQYQKAVLKSRFSSLMPLAKALSDSEEAYYLEHGTYTEDKTKLDVTTTDTNANVTLGNEEQHQYVKLTRSDIKNQLTIYQKHSPNFAGETHCEALIDDAQANWLCADSLKGTYVGNKFGYSIYSLSIPQGSLDRLYYDTQHIALTEGDKCIASSVFGCTHSTYAEGATCVTKNRYGCEYGTFTNGAGATGTAYDSIHHSSFDNAYCEANALWNCRQGIYANHSVCTANGTETCYSSTYDTSSSCVGNGARSCTGSKFTNSSICYANASGACANNTYDETSYCTGDYCPAGARKEDGTLW